MPLMVPPQKQSSRPNIAAINFPLSPPFYRRWSALGVVFSECLGWQVGQEGWSCLSSQSKAGFSWRAKQWHLVYSHMFETMDSSGIAIQLPTQYLSAGIQWSLYNGSRMIGLGWWGRHIIISLQRCSQLTIHKEWQTHLNEKLCGTYRLLS